MKKILFITSRNIINTSGEMRLIKNRNHVMNIQYGIKTDFIAIFDKKKLGGKRESVSDDSVVKHVKYSKYNPFSYFFMYYQTKKTIKKMIEEKNYDSIIVSGPLAIVFTRYVRHMFNKSNMILDIHGALEELIEFKSDNFYKNIGKRITYILLKYLEKTNINFYDAYFVVSDALSAYLDHEYRISKKNKYIIPCSLEEDQIELEQKVKYRMEFRKYYGINDELLFVYSGGVSPWQCIEETISMFIKIQKKIQGKNVKLLILSHELEKIKHLGINDSIIMDSLQSDMVNKVLCAGDYAFLLRDNYVTNNVAFPNKFLEYVNSGMRIITTPYVHDVKKYINEYHLGFIVENINENQDNLMKYFQEDFVYGDDFQKRKKLISSLSFNKTLKTFAENLN
ncbi:hypothetical protein [Globicatella sulfidifaciens]|uniref:Glycosyltransferase family 4 protein n=1 Tax=Globicatella sulfidifaciens TaxID=136093 RepID=A0A7X8C1S2_9LACT|nr:hypothetical protein [Globicatella sulfidifaciens]NLJ17365.1 glycosyltransferase family 4 protein [Globicatella sulfidifaciens]